MNKQNEGHLFLMASFDFNNVKLVSIEFWHWDYWYLVNFWGGLWPLDVEAYGLLPIFVWLTSFLKNQKVKKLKLESH